MNWTPEQLSAILTANNQVGIDTSATAPGNTDQDDRIPAKSARSEARGAEIDTNTTPTQFEAILTGFCASHGFPPPVFEYKFHPRRKWKADAAIPSIMVLVEMEGGIWMKTTNGRSKGHAHPKRFLADIEKYNAAELSGWHVLRFTTAMLQDGRMLATLAELPPF